MIDLPLMAKLVDAVRPDARLVLLGDRDQLASVEAGCVLADVCGDAGAPRVAPDGLPDAAPNAAPNASRNRSRHPSSDTPGDSADDMPPIARCVTRLVRSYRFDAGGGIGQLARAINGGDADAVIALLEDAHTAHAPDGAIGFVPVDTASGGRAGLAALRALVSAEYHRIVCIDGPKAALDAIDEFRVLAAHREGAYGVAGLNAAVVGALVSKGTITRDAAARTWYHGQPVLVTENDDALDLHNGDVGVVLRDGSAGSLRVWFRAADGTARGIAPARLPAHEPVFATTVHKAQGSQFRHVVLVLPPSPSPVLTRELLYTGVTRARRRVTVVGSIATIRAAVAARVRRAGGLREALWNDTSSSNAHFPST